MLFSLATITVKSQVSIATINPITEPHEDAVLDLQSVDHGLLLPRVQLESTTSATPLTSHVAGMTVYNIGANGTGPTSVFSGLYYNDGKQWVSLPLNYTKWFYMPSIPFETDASAVKQTKDLYSEYLRQFGSGTTENTNFVASQGAPLAIPHLPSATDLYYYITDYDPAVFSNISIDANGVMTYDVTPAATDYSYINIVFVLK